MAKRNNQTTATVNGADNPETETEAQESTRKRRQQDPAERKARQVAMAILRRFLAMLRDGVASSEAVTLNAEPSDGDNGVNAAGVHAALTRLVSVSLGGRIERAKAAYDVVRKHIRHAAGWIPQITLGTIPEAQACGTNDQFALSLTDPMLPPDEYIVMERETDVDMSETPIVIVSSDGSVNEMPAGMLANCDAVRFHDDVPPAEVAAMLRGWIDLPKSQVDPRERVKSAIKQYESIVNKNPDNVSAASNLETLRDNLETLNADPSYMTADAKSNGSE